MLREYLTPEVSADDFRRRLLAAMDDHNACDSAQRSDLNTADPITQDVLISQLPSQGTRTLQSTPSESRGGTRFEKDAGKTESAKNHTLTKRSSLREPERKSNINIGRATQAPQKQAQLDNEDTATHPTATSIPQSSAARGPPNQYRLQVRLFDGTSIRSSFSPQQTIGRDVRSWLDEQMADNHRPYNLKHILTPLPSRTFSISEESKALGELGLESTANLVMVPVQSYTEAYAAPSGSLPIRVISSIYSGASSVANTATGLVGSFFGYASNGSAVETSTSASSSLTERRRRQIQSRPVIRTLRDQQNDRKDNQFYNGNQVGHSHGDVALVFELRPRQ